MHYSIDYPCPVDSNGNAVSNAPTITGDGVATDGSGYSWDQSSQTVRSRDGQAINTPYKDADIGTINDIASVTDTNGNVIKAKGDGTYQMKLRT